MAIRYQPPDKLPVVPNTRVKPAIVKFAPIPQRLIEPAIVKTAAKQAVIVKTQSAPTNARKQAVSIRLDVGIIEHYKRGGPGWQSRINADLLAISQNQKP